MVPTQALAKSAIIITTPGVRNSRKVPVPELKPGISTTDLKSCPKRSNQTIGWMIFKKRNAGVRQRPRSDLPVSFLTAPRSFLDTTPWQFWLKVLAATP